MTIDEKTLCQMHADANKMYMYQWCEKYRALLSASIADTATEPTDLLPNALWTRRGSGTDEWWSFKGYQARKDAADQWVLRKGGEELYRHTYLQVVMAHAERQILASAEIIADTAGAKPIVKDLLAQHVELNLGNYTDDDVRTLNNWALDACAVLSDIDTAGAKPIYQVLEPCEAVWSDTDWLTYESTDGAFKRIVYLAATPAPSVADAAGAKLNQVSEFRDEMFAISADMNNSSGTRTTCNIVAVRLSSILDATPASSVADAAGASERARFEAWLTETDDYVVDAQWEAWQAAIAKESGND